LDFETFHYFQLYCKKGPLAKEKRDIFVEGSMDEIRERFDSLMSYCASDVAATSDVFRAVFPLFRARC
jgi:DNA polymerase gamma 1